MGLFTKNKKSLKLDFCTNNIDRFYDDESFEQLEQLIGDHKVKVREMDCLSFCDECECAPYVLINNEFVDAKSPQELFEQIKKQF